MRRSLLTLLGLLLLVYLALQTETVQQALVNYFTQKLSKELGTELRVKRINISFFNRLQAEGILVRDKQKDSLLYAGKLTVNLTDWFFLKSLTELKYIGLEDAVIKLQRKDSVWNYQFLVDHFSKPRTKASPTKKKPMALALRRLELKNFRFFNNDLWTGDITQAKITALSLEPEKIDLAQQLFVVQKIDLVQPKIDLYSLDPLRPDSLKPKKKNTPDTGYYFNAGNITLQARECNIRNGHLFIESNLDKADPGFDGAHIEMTRLNANIKNLVFAADTLRANVLLSVKDRSGLEIKKLKTKFRLTPQIMELAQLDLQTNKSRLGNYYAMRFKDFNRDFNEYIDSVVMDARLNQTVVHSDDLAFFAPELKNWHTTATLNGRFLGTVAQFKVSGLDAKIGTATSLKGNFSMKGLPDIDRTYMDLENGVLQTQANDLRLLVPALKELNNPDFYALGKILYRGNFTGTIHNLNSKGFLSTQLGGIKTDISLQLPLQGEPSYKGALSTAGFDLGKFIQMKDLGTVKLSAKINGNSFLLSKMKTSFDGDIQSIQYRGYAYQNIKANGSFQRKYFNGALEIFDPNLSFTSQVEIDLSKDVPKFDFLGDLAKANVQALGFYKDSLTVSGLVDVNFTGKNIDDFIGSAKFLNGTVFNGRQAIRFDSLNLLSFYKDSIKTLHLGSNDINATIYGQFNILSLPASFQSFLHQYYPTYIQEPSTRPQNQDFRFTLNTQYFEPYVQIFTPRFKGGNDVSLSGSINTSKSLLGLAGYVPYVAWDDLALTGTLLRGTGNFDSLSLVSTVKRIDFRDSIYFPNTSLNLLSQKDHSVVSIKTSASNTFKDAEIKADVYTLSDGARIQFQSSQFVLNDKLWSIDKGGEIIARKNLLLANQLKLSQGIQEININTEEAEGGNTRQVVARIKNLVLGDLISLFTQSIPLEGIASGTIALNDVMDKFEANAQLEVNEFRFDQDSIGTVSIDGGFDKTSRKIPFRLRSNNPGYQLDAKGFYDTKDSTGKGLRTAIQMDDARLSVIQMFLSDLFSDLKGQASGLLQLNGDINAPDLLGDVRIRNAGLTVNYTQVHYNIDSALLRFEPDGINLGTITLKDDLNHTGTISGKLYETGFENMVFDFDMETDKLLLINTKAKDNSQFYGQATGKAKMSFKGPQSNCKMTIVAEANDSSHIYLPMSDSKESAAADFIVFKSYGKEMEAPKESSGFNLTVDLDLVANNKVQIEVILDELTGDIIKAVGNGRLRIKAGTIEPLTMKGRYNIERGNYDFNFQSFLTKPFELLPNAGNYIEWNGDPTKADLHIDARYTAERVTLSDLIGNNSFSGSVKGYRGDVYVIAALRNLMTKPDISFKLDFPQGSPIKNDNEFQAFLNRIEKDENEMLKQVSFLIVFNAFAPPGEATASSGANPYALSTLGINTLSQLLTKEIDKAISGLLYKVFKDKSLQFDLGASLYSSSSFLSSSGANVPVSNSALDRTRVNFKVGKSFWNNNVLVTFGGDLDFSLGGSSVQSGNFQWLPDLNIEIILSEDRKLRAIIFSKNSLDISGANFGRRNRQGISISYRKDFEKLFGNKEKEIALPPPPAKN